MKDARRLPGVFHQSLLGHANSTSSNFCMVCMTVLLTGRASYAKFFWSGLIAVARLPKAYRPRTALSPLVGPRTLGAYVIHQAFKVGGGMGENPCLQQPACRVRAPDIFTEG
jgi:hypothetical protein